MRFSIILPCLFLLGSATAQQQWTLEQCLERAEQQNLVFRNVQLETELARKVSKQSRWALLPDLNAGATHGYNWGKAVDRYTNTFATDRVRTNNLWLSSNWILFQGLRLQNERIKADLDTDASSKGLEAQRNSIRRDVVSAYLDVLSLREGINAAKAQASSTQGQVDVIKAFVDAGRVARSQLLDLDAQLAREELTVVQIENQYTQTLLQFGQLLFLSPEEQRTFDIVAPAIAAISITEPTRTVEEIMPAVLASDPAYSRALLNVESAEKAEAIAKSGGIPSVSFNASVSTGYSGLNQVAVGEPILQDPIPIGATQGGELVYAPNYNYNTEVTDFGTQLDDNLNESVGFTLSVPIFNNMRNRLAVDQAYVLKEQREILRGIEQQRVQRDIQEALNQQRSAYREFHSASRALEASTEALRYAQERFTAGAITSVELNTAKNNVARTTVDVITARYSWVKAAKSLEILQGLPVSL
ncbi:MAG: TolC family protein [Flavobacteriales bacterium]